MVEGEESSPCAVNACQASSSLVDQPIVVWNRWLHFLRFHRQRAGRKPVSKTSSAGFESLAACNGERTWLGHGQAGNLCKPSGFRFDSDALLTWKVNAAGPRTASKAEGALGIGVRFARLPRRVARTVRGRSAKPKPVVVSPEQVRLLHSPLTSWPRGEVPVCKTGNAGSTPAEVSRLLRAQGVSGCTPDRQSEGAGSIPAGRSVGGLGTLEGAPKPSRELAPPGVARLRQRSSSAPLSERSGPSLPS